MKWSRVVALGFFQLQICCHHLPNVVSPFTRWFYKHRSCSCAFSTLMTRNHSWSCLCSSSQHRARIRSPPSLDMAMLGQIWGRQSQLLEISNVLVLGSLLVGADTATSVAKFGSRDGSFWGEMMGMWIWLQGAARPSSSPRKDVSTSSGYAQL